MKPQALLRRPVLLAALLSFAVWLLPIYLPHAGFALVPVVLIAGLFDGGIMALAAFAGAGLLQGLVALAFYFLVRRVHWWKWLAVLLSLPLLWFAVNVTFLYAIPALVLIEPDWSEDQGDLERVCVAPDVSLVPVRSGVSLSVESYGIAWVRAGQPAEIGVLTMPGCHVAHVTELGSRRQLKSVNAMRESFSSDYDQRYFYTRTDMTDVEHIKPPDGLKNWNAVLTSGGGALAWLERGAAGPSGRPHQIRVRDLLYPRRDGGNEQTIDVALPPRNSLTLLEAAPPLFTLARYRNEILVVDESGSVVWGPVSPPGVYDARWGFRRVGSNGWVAWDGYREEGRSRIVWSLASGSGEAVMPRGRSLESVAVSPDGRRLAYSTESNSYFNASGRLVVLQTHDGGIVYRRRLAQFARVQLAFLGDDYLAFRDLEGSDGLAVFRIPNDQ